MVCLDSTFLIDLFRGDKQAIKKMAELERTSESIVVAVPTVVEFATGASLATSKRERDGLTRFLSTASVLSLDQKSALIAGEINATLIRGGEQIGAFDVLIGAIALANKERILTRNARHFTRIEGLEVEEYLARLR